MLAGIRDKSKKQYITADTNPNVKNTTILQKEKRKNFALSEPSFSHGFPYINVINFNIVPPYIPEVFMKAFNYRVPLA